MEGLTKEDIDFIQNNKNSEIFRVVLKVLHKLEWQFINELRTCDSDVNKLLSIQGKIKGVHSCINTLNAQSHVDVKNSK